MFLERVGREISGRVAGFDGDWVGLLIRGIDFSALYSGLRCCTARVTVARTEEVCEDIHRSIVCLEEMIMMDCRYQSPSNNAMKGL